MSNVNRPYKNKAVKTKARFKPIVIKRAQLNAYSATEGKYVDQFYFIIQAPNKQVLVTSETYTRKSNAIKAATSVAKQFGNFEAGNHPKIFETLYVEDRSWRDPGAEDALG